MVIEKSEVTLSSGQKAQYEYDREGDILEIIFQPGEATCAVDLTESIILRFNWETGEPLSIGFIGFSRLIQPTEFGETYFQLLHDEWPEDMQAKVWQILENPSVNEFLNIGSFTPSKKRKSVPIASVRQPQLTLS
ncbi:MAG TPA: DUF2283 domain-containing protein [Anaerolineae bacterium]